MAAALVLVWSVGLLAMEAAGNNKITELGKQARQGQLYVFTYVQYYGTELPIAALYKKDDFV